MRPTPDEVAHRSVDRSTFSEVLRRWPIVVGIGLLALTSSLLAAGSRTPSYSATARLILTPLPQWDETFLGTSLVRDSGDANRTAATMAEVVDSAEVAREASRLLAGRTTERAIRRAVDVQPMPDTNVLAVTAVAADPARAVRLADAFASSVLTVRWRTIERELDQRIALITAIGGGDPENGEVAQVSRALRVTRSAGRDPTMTLEKSDSATRVEELPKAVVAALGTAGGLFLGGLIAAAMGRMATRRPAATPAELE